MDILLPICFVVWLALLLWVIALGVSVVFSILFGAGKVMVGICRIVKDVFHRRDTLTQTTRIVPITPEEIHTEWDAAVQRSKEEVQHNIEHLNLKRCHHSCCATYCKFPKEN